MGIRQIVADADPAAVGDIDHGRSRLRGGGLLQRSSCSCELPPSDLGVLGTIVRPDKALACRFLGTTATWLLVAELNILCFEGTIQG
jgi:hypothetical protein